MRKIFKNIARDNAGATAIEYGLIAALIAVAAIGSMTLVGEQLDTTLGKVATDMEVNP